MGLLRSRSTRRRPAPEDGDRLLIALVNEARTPDELRGVLGRARRGRTSRLTALRALRR